MKQKERYIVEPAGSFFLLGPRGTGKSTWIESRTSEAIFVNLLEPDVLRRYTAHPERLYDLLEANKNNQTVVIDEIQRAPELLPVIHHTIEKHRMRFLLTGSSARKLKRTGMDLLAGRAVVSQAHPFMASELGLDFSLDTALNLGMVPLVLDAAEPQKTLEAYIMLYIKEEIQAEGLIRNIGAFTRFLEAISFSHASLLNVAEVARECEVSRKTVEGYISVLEDMLLGTQLPVFSKKAKRNLIKQSKFYYFDTGVFRSVRPKGPLDQPTEIHGLALEGLIFQHLQAWKDYTDGHNELYFWRTKSGTEVDFVIYGEHEFCAIEIKNSRNVHRKDLRGLKSFMTDYPQTKACLLYRGKDRLLIDNILCIPCDEFLMNLRPNQPIL